MKNSRAAIAKRQNYILQKLNKERSVAVEELTQELKVSALTVRRDLDDLAAQGKVERFFGGARFVGELLPRMKTDAAFRADTTYENKKRMIAEAAVSLVNEGDTILINSSTTAFYMFPLLAEMKVTVITNNANALHTVDNAKYELIFTGGGINSLKHSMVGPLALSALKNIRANKCFIGVSGISETGILSTALFQETAVNSSMISQANEAVIVLADSTKIGVQHNFDIGSLDRVSHIVTDADATAGQLAILRKYKLDVIIAPNEK
ncbi:MAG: DeoR/GlpR family DNA-binding transcription regulator [Treponema sp.]